MPDFLGLQRPETRAAISSGEATTRSMLTPYLVGIAESVTYKLPGF